MKNEILLSIISVFFIVSCVNTDYDGLLDVEIGNVMDTVVAPLGHTGKVVLADLIDIDNLSDIYIEDNKYNIRFSDEIGFMDVPVVEIVDFNAPLEFIVPPAFITIINDLPNIGGVIGPLPEEKIKTSRLSFGQIAFSDAIEKIDSVLMDTSSENRTKFDMSIDLQGFDFEDVDAEFIFDIVMPVGYEFSSSEYHFNVDSGVYSTRIRASYDEVAAGQFNISFFADKIGEVALNIQADITVSLEITSAKKLAFVASPEILANVRIYNMDFTAVYGRFNIAETIPEITVSLSDISNLFGDDAVLDFYNPMINILGTHNFGFKTKFDLKFASRKKGVELEMLPIPLALSAVNKPGDIDDFSYSISQINNQIAGADWIKSDVGSLLSNGADEVVILGTVSDLPSIQSFITNTPITTAEYEINVPFSAGKDFYMKISEQFKDIFDEALADKLFNSGSLEFFGNIRNTLPLNLEVLMIPLDADGNPVGVDLGKSLVSGSDNSVPSESTLSFKLKEEDMSKMRNAKSLELVIKALSSEALEGIQIKDTDFIEINLNWMKIGGITI